MLILTFVLANLAAWPAFAGKCNAILGNQAVNAFATNTLPEYFISQKDFFSRLRPPASRARSEKQVVLTEALKRRIANSGKDVIVAYFLIHQRGRRDAAVVRQFEEQNLSETEISEFFELPHSVRTLSVRARAAPEDIARFLLSEQGRRDVLWAGTSYPDDFVDRVQTVGGEDLLTFFERAGGSVFRVRR